MRKTFQMVCLIGGLAIAAWGQSSDIRRSSLNSEAPGGQLLLDAGASQDPAEKVQLLERFLSEFSGSEYRGYALLQLQQAAIQAQQYEKAVEAGRQLLEIAPDDVEVRHNVNQSLVALGRWDELYPSIVETRKLAEEEAARPQGDLDEAAWKGQVDYAEGVKQYTEWAMNTAATQQTDPAKKIQWLDLLVESYPDGQYAKDAASGYAIAYQQAGDADKAIEWMQKAVDSGQQNPAFLYALGEGALAKAEIEKAKEYGQKLIEMTAADPNLSEDQKKQWQAYGQYITGRAWVAQNTKDAYRTGRTHLLQAVDYLKSEGGPRYGILAYFLGVCYVQLDIQGDNIRRALQWMTEAANTESPYQAQAQQDLAKLKSVL